MNQPKMPPQIAQMMQDQQPTPEQALQYLNDATADVKGDRRQHDQIRQSLSILKTTVQQWRAMQSGENEDPEDPRKLLTEG